jgi:transposase InsO family protein
MRAHPRFGYRWLWAMVRRRGSCFNRKRLHRLWKKNGLRESQKQTKKRRLGSGDDGCVRRRAKHRDYVWAWDFIFDRTLSGRTIKGLSMVPIGDTNGDRPQRHQLFLNNFKDFAETWGDGNKSEISDSRKS